MSNRHTGSRVSHATVQDFDLMSIQEKLDFYYLLRRRAELFGEQRSDYFLVEEKLKDDLRR